jgi:hypothetical protein
VNIVFLKHICDCLGCDRVGHGVVDKVGGLNSIIKPFSGDLMDNNFLLQGESLEKWPPLPFFLFPSISFFILSIVDFSKPVLD